MAIPEDLMHIGDLIYDGNDVSTSTRRRTLSYNETMSPDTTTVTINFDQPSLEILDQPQALFRFRYAKESTKPHGPLRGTNAERMQLKAGPEVKLCNFHGEAIIRCWLTCPNSSHPSPHQLVGQSDNGELVYEPHEIRVNSDNNYTARYDKLNIIHGVLKQKTYSEYYERKKYCMLYGFNDPNAEINYDRTMKEMKLLEKNMASLLFQVFVEVDGNYLKIAEMISEPVKNKKNPRTSDLKICRVCSIRGSCLGGQEVFLLVEKVVPEIKIKFYEIDPKTNEEIWSDYAQFYPSEIHHQVAIPIKTPRYRDTTITKEVQVFFRLVRESDDAVSPPQKYYYTPSEEYSEPFSKKRKMFYSADSSTIGFIPTVISENSIGSPQGSELDSAIDILSSNSNSTPSPYFEIESFDPEALINECLGLPSFNDSQVETDSVALPEKKGTDKINVKKSTVNSITEDQLIQISLLHDAILRQNKSEFAQILSKCIQIEAFLEVKNHLNKTPLQMAVQMKNLQFVEMLLEAGSSLEAVDGSYNTLLHLAIKQFPQSLKTLLKKCPKDLHEKCNGGGDNALLLAAREDSLESLETLIENGWDLNFQNLKTGDTPLHIATLYKHTNSIILLLKNGAELNLENNSGFTPVHYAASDGMINILKMFLATGIVLKPEYNEITNGEMKNVLKGHNIFEMNISNEIKDLLEAKSNQIEFPEKEAIISESMKAKTISILDNNVDITCQLVEKIGHHHLIPLMKCSSDSSTKRSDILLKYLEGEHSDPMEFIYKHLSDLNLT